MSKEASLDVQSGFLLWQDISLAPANVPVEVKIDDKDGCRNECVLTRRGRLWYTETADNVGMYVYWTPTHWRHTVPTGE